MDRECRANPQGEPQKDVEVETGLETEDQPEGELGKPQELLKAQRALNAIGGKRIERHIFLCAMSEKQKCCSREDGEAAWNYLKKRLKQLGLTDPQRGQGPVQRSKADCLQICAMGPIAVIWPDRVWYHSCTENNLEKIIQSHLIRGEVVSELHLDTIPE